MVNSKITEYENVVSSLDLCFLKLSLFEELLHRKDYASFIPDNVMDLLSETVSSVEDSLMFFRYFLEPLSLGFSDSISDERVTLS